MTDEAHHIARQAAALDDPAVVREDVPDRIYITPGLIRQAGGYPATLTTAGNPRAVPYVHADRMREAQASISELLEIVERASDKRAYRAVKARARAALAAAPQPMGCGYPCGFDCNGACFDVGTAPQPAPVDREPLVEVIRDALRVWHDPDRISLPLSGAIADALLARGLHLPGADAEAELDAAFAAGLEAAAEAVLYLCRMKGMGNRTIDGPEAAHLIRALPINPRP